MKCSNCPQFTSKDTENELEGDLEIDAAGVITGDVRIFNTCQECGNELEEYTFNVHIDLSQEVAQHRDDIHSEDKDLCELSMVDESIERTDETQQKDRNGKLITRARYKRRYYGIEVSVGVSCDDCEMTLAEGTFTDRVAASGMEWIG